MRITPAHANYAKFQDFLQGRKKSPEIISLPFQSQSYDLLPGRDECGPAGEDLADLEIRENRSFEYLLFTGNPGEKSKEILFLFHGLNERAWDKYLPWAYSLWERTGKTVVLFPLAFHINRAPASWSSARTMTQISRERTRNQGALDSSFFNAALSSRLQENPRRFIWSGFESYFDVIQIMRTIRSGRHPYIHGNAEVDFFSYSIGAFLTELLLMQNPDNFFSESKAFLFCGGSTLQAMNPVSRYILDSNAGGALMTYMLGDLQKELTLNTRLTRFFRRTWELGMYYMSMIGFDSLKELRDNAFNALAGRLKICALKKDRVIPADAIKKTAEPAGGENSRMIDILDFPFAYSHENPFPPEGENPETVQQGFEQVFALAEDFL